MSDDSYPPTRAAFRFLAVAAAVTAVRLLFSDRGLGGSLRSGLKAGGLAAAGDYALYRVLGGDVEDGEAIADVDPVEVTVDPEP